LLSLKDFLKQFPFFYPARIIESCTEWIDKENQKSGVYTGARKHTYKLILDAESYTHALPNLLAENDADKFSVNVFYQTVPVYLFYLKDCYLYKQMGLVLTNRGVLFQEFTHHFGIATLKKFILKHPFYTYSNQIRQVNGVGAVLISPQSQNYYHWLFDVLPRIKLYESVFGHITHFCISSAVPQKFLNVLPQFGIPLNKVLLIDDTEKLHFNNLYVSSLPGSEGRSPLWGINYVREKLIKDKMPAPATSKLYFKRGSKIERKILNEEALIAFLKKNDFDVIEPDALTIDQQITLMQHAQVVISAHGAALSNLIFVRQGTTVVELFSPDYFRTDCYFTLARLLNLNYHYLRGNKPANANWGDITVDITSLTGLLKIILDQ